MVDEVSEREIMDFHYSLIKTLTVKLEALTERLEVVEGEVKAHSEGLSEAPKPWNEPSSGGGIGYGA